MLKLYIVVNGRLSPAHQACQSVHAMAEFAHTHTKEFVEWTTGNNTICLLEASNELQLEALCEKAKDGGFKHAPFYEPDIESLGGHQRNYNSPLFGPGPWLTAVAFAPNWIVQNVLLKDLVPALRRERVAESVGLYEDYEVVNSRAQQKISKIASEAIMLRDRSPKHRARAVKTEPFWTKGNNDD